MAAMRKMKNVVNNYSPAEVKVREATSNDPWGPSSSVMSEIADMTYNVVAFSEIMTMIWKRINDHGKNWRHVYKALVLLDYIIKTGSERVAQQCRENIFAIQTLKDFHFYDRDGKDQGLNVREKSKALVSLLKDDERLKTERERALKAKERFAMASQAVGSGSGGTDDVEIGKPAGESRNPERPPASTELEQARPHTAGEEELQLQLAIAMSKEEAQKSEIEQKHDDLRLQMALSESADETGGQLEVQPPAHQPTSTLLNLVETPPALSAPKPDPWGAQPSIPANDPWGAPAAVNSAPAIVNDPWGAGPPSQPSVISEPWGAPPPVQQPVPPTQPPAPQVDPWGVSAAPHAPAVDPWGSQTAPPRPPQDPDNEFDLLRNDGMMTSSSAMMAQSAPPSAYPTPQTNGTSGALSKTQKPEDFLGKNSNLVNLDSLVGPIQKGPTLTASNPFLMTGAAAAPPPMGAPVANPFHQQRAPAPSINQLRQQPFQQPQNVPSGSFQPSFPAAGDPSLPPPLIPASSAPHGGQQNPFM